MISYFSEEEFSRLSPDVQSFFKDALSGSAISDESVKVGGTDAGFDNHIGLDIIGKENAGASF